MDSRKALCLIPLIILFAFQTLGYVQNRTADLVVINAKVRTMTARDSVVEAFAVSGSRISSIGSNKLINKLIGPSTRVVDAKGRLVLPGFNDSHVHFMGIGNSFSTIDLRDVNTPDAMMSQVARYVRFLPRGRWVLGSGLSPPLLPERAAIDRTAVDNPVFIYLSDAKSAFANMRALELAGLKDDGSTVDGIVRGESLRKLARAVPANHTRNWPEIAETASKYAASVGVTSVQDMHTDDSRQVYRELHRVGKLKTRVYDCISLTDWNKLVAPEARREDDEMIRGGCLKSFSDGDQAEVSKLLADILAADKAGLQVMVHAIGHSANDVVLGLFEQVAKLNRKRDRRFRIEHAHNPTQDDLPRFSSANIVASMQPHLFSGGSGGYYSSLLRLKTKIAFGSDAAITDLNPILGIHAAVSAGAESISVYDAVRAYTIGSAFAEFQEKEKGTIETGKLADFVILSDDIFTIETPKIRDTSVVMTVADGRIVYQSD